MIFQEIVQESSFVLDNDTHYYCNDTGRIIVGNYLLFLLAVLNSKLFFFAVKNYYGGGKLGEHGIRMKHTFFLNFPCVPPCESLERLAMKCPDNYEVVARIDNKIYELYGLTTEEINLIEEE
ncbi:MAG: hypothetical protein HUK09_09615 [Bacteroidaceae bacterium]|nr:hypothetical protein [Bacteroidaceae bacterium]